MPLSNCQYRKRKTYNESKLILLWIILWYTRHWVYKQETGNKTQEFKSRERFGIYQLQQVNHKANDINK